jgi:hypothetical protein
MEQGIPDKGEDVAEAHAGSEVREDSPRVKDASDKLGGIAPAMAKHLPADRPGRVEGEFAGYFGACGVYSPDEARAMADALRSERKYPDRKVMIGVMTHRLVLRDDLGIPQEVLDEVRAEFPDREEMAAGFTDDPDVFNTVHYADLYSPDGPRKGGDAPDVCENLELVVKYGGENLHAIQLDVTWPSADELKRFKEKHPDVAIILQVGKFGLAEVDGDPHAVVEKLREYGDSVDYTLLDTSMGMGKGMNAERLLPMLRTIRDQLPEMGLAVAGGLGPDSVDLLEPIAAEFPDISIDAEGNLKREDTPRDERGHILATEPVDLGRTTDYIQKSCAALDNPGVRQRGIPAPTEEVKP